MPLPPEVSNSSRLLELERLTTAHPAALEKRPIPVGFVLLLGALTMFGPMSIDMYLPALPSIARDLHGTTAEAERTLAAFFIGLALGQLVYGPVSDRLGRKTPLLFGIVLYVIASIACAFAPSLPALVGLRFVQALGGCAGMVISRAVVRDRFDHHQVVHVLSLLLLVMGLAPILAPLAGGWLLQVASWRAIFLALAGFGVLTGLACMLLLTETRTREAAAEARGESPLRSYLALLGNRRLMGYLLTSALAGTGFFTYISTSAELIIGTYGVPPSLFGWVFGLNAAGFIGASQLNSRLERAYGSDRVLRTANLVTFGISLVMLAGAASGVGGPYGVMVPLFFMMASMGFTQPNAMAGALGVDPQRSGAVSALMGSAGFGVGAVSAAATAAIPLPTPLRMALVIALAMAGSVIALRTLVRGDRSVKDVAPGQDVVAQAD